MIRRAQAVLRDLGYYKAPVTGVVGTQMKASLRTFQRDYDLEQTSALDFDTAYALGLVNEDGIAILPVKILNATAERLTDGTIRVKGNAQANTGGWYVFADSTIDGDLLRVNVKGTPPEGVATQAITRYPIDLSVRDNGGVRRVVVRGEGTPITLELGSPGLDLVRQTHIQTAGLFDTYKGAIGVGRPGSGSGDFTNIDRLTEAQAQVLSALSNLNNSALFAEQLILVRAPDQAVRGTLTQLMREARQANRLLQRTNEMPRLERQWGDFDRNLRKLVDVYRVTYDTSDRD
jgi:peptidoglycan hydrolase-like protein with peptidoglycan-binding domain